LACIATIAVAIALGLLAVPGHSKFAGAATVSVTNPSLESDANHDGVPDCWQRNGSGKSRYSFTHTTDAHSGGFAEQVAISRYWSGARQLLVQMGSSGCGPLVTAGHTYTFTAWYKGKGQAQFSALYRNTSGTWVSWVSGPALPVTGSWTQGSYLASALPADATEISFGIALQSAGSITTDDYALTDSGSGTSTSSSPTSSSSPVSSSSAPSSPTSATSTASSPSSSTTSASTTTTTTSPLSSPSPTNTTSSTASTAPPPTGGYSPTLVPPGNVTALPDGKSCASAVHHSSWEPRPDNYKRNHVLVDAAAVHNSFSTRPRSGLGSYDPRWDSWLLPRVDGQFSGTTDEIIQWAACKWGLPDNYLRAEADTESTWFQYETYPSGRCVDQYGCGDWFSSEPYAARKTYCDGLASAGGYNYQSDYGDGLCPKTFSIVGIMTWWNPSWGFNWAGNQNGTFPFTRNSTAMALDYMASQIRGCYEGWQSELGSSYTSGDLWGCAGAWYSGGWHDSRANTYISHVQANESAEPWLTASFAAEKPPCDPNYGCPGPDPLQ
jgi:hypothetical protein